MPTDLKVWKDRWLALDQHLAVLEDRLMQTNGLVDRKHVLQELVIGLRAFGKAHFDFFHYGFETGRLKPEFEATIDNVKQRVILSPDYVLRQVIERITMDTRVIFQAIEQRVFYSNYTSLDSDTEEIRENIVDSLLNADKLAFAALQPAIRYGILDAPLTALTYLRRDAAVRVIPYAPVALVGVPLTSLIESRDFLAIPHEVGHYVYWNAHALAPNTTKKLRTQITAGKDKEWLHKWTEEIFADTYGGLVGGQSVGLSFQDLADETDDFEFKGDEGEHPVPLLRAQVYFEILKQKYGPDATRELVIRWQEIVERRGALDDTIEKPVITDSTPVDTAIEALWSSLKLKKFNLLNDENHMNVASLVEVSRSEITKGLSDVVKDILTKLPTLQSEADSISNLITYDPIRDGIPEFNMLKGFIRSVITNIGPGFDALPATARRDWETWGVEKGIIAPGDRSAESYDKAWLNIFRADGWTLQGPHTQPGDD